MYCNIALQCRNHNLFPVLCIVPKVNYQLLCKVNNFLHEECVENGFGFIDNLEVTEKNLCKDGIHMIKSSKCLVANNFICHFKNF